ncbi:hypothetical protein ACFFQW_04245 [Umezawaea endophytica]|uniref:PknH-like protein n=1 Tax=Umezawaea endophytica TaxID=1654476 RepID=A0A9X2VGV4_9PSEU|nr:hypothetical protein [Umezawaea endophytica]MCS7476420.1 hypothetical protein [Umezawaea endophytica]
MRVPRCLFTAALITVLAGCSGGTTAAPPSASSAAPTTTTSAAPPTVEQMPPEEADAGLRRGMITEARLGELGYTTAEPFTISRKPSHVVSTCGGETEVNDRVYGWALAKYTRAGVALTTQVSHFELMTAGEALEQVRALATCPGYQQPDGRALTMHYDVTVPPVAGVDGELSYCAEAEGGVGFCHLLLTHQSFLSATTVVAPSRAAALGLLGELAPELGAAIITA